MSLKITYAQSTQMIAKLQELSFYELSPQSLIGISQVNNFEHCILVEIG
jgi:hypothetical protein